MTKAFLLTIALGAAAVSLSAQAADSSESGMQYLVQSVGPELGTSNKFPMQILEIKTGQVLTVILSPDEIVQVGPKAFAVDPNINFWDI